MADTAQPRTRRLSSLDVLVIVVALAALGIAIYELNLASLVRRLVAEIDDWSRDGQAERIRRAARRDVSRETPLVDVETIREEVDRRSRESAQDIVDAEPVDEPAAEPVDEPGEGP